MNSSNHEDLIAQMALNLGLDEFVVAEVIAEFMLQLHRGIVEYEGFNGDYVGEALSHELGNQAFYHFLGFLDRFSERYEWEPGTAHEYIARLGMRANWLPYVHQMGGWIESSRYGNRKKADNEGEAL